MGLLGFAVVGTVAVGVAQPFLRDGALLLHRWKENRKQVRRLMWSIAVVFIFNGYVLCEHMRARTVGQPYILRIIK